RGSLRHPDQQARIRQLDLRRLFRARRLRLFLRQRLRDRRRLRRRRVRRQADRQAQVLPDPGGEGEQEQRAQRAQPRPVERIMSCMTLRVISRLMSYPTAELQAAVPEMTDVIRRESVL